MIVLQALRSLLFYGLFLGQTVILAIVVGTMGIVAGGRTRWGWAIAKYWGESNKWLLRWVVGIKTSVEDLHNIPEGPCIFAAKHMSDWDIFALLPPSERPAFIAKKELMDIPFFGRAARTFDTIRIDRSLGAGAIPAMLADAREAIGRGCRIIIFPEGTRRLPLAAPDYRQGIVHMYEGLGVPVVPVALDSGLYWPRNSLILWPGTARAKFLPPIMPGLPAAQFKQQLIEAVEGGTDQLIAEAAKRGLRRPIPAGMQTKLDELEARKTTTY